MYKMLTGQQADQARIKIADVMTDIGRPDLASPARVTRDLQEIDSALLWLAEQGYSFAVDDWLADDGINFVHDWTGILRHIDSVTGELAGCFIPRFARHESDNVAV